MTPSLTRRHALAGAAALGASAALPFRARAEGSVIAAMYPGNWDEAYRTIVGPAVAEAHGIDVQFTPLYAVDQIAKAQASRGLAPFDVFVLDPGPRVAAIDAGLFGPFDASKLENAAKLPDYLIDEHGIGVAAQVVGIAYNPTKLDPPAGWADLFEEPYASRLGLTGFQTTFGTTSLIEISKVFGGSETDVDPAFEKIGEILPEVAAVAAPSAMAGLFQQGQIDLMYTNTATVATLAARGVDIAFATPETGAIAFFTTMHLVENPEAPDNAYRYIDTAISAPVQAQLMAAPFNLIPVNGEVELIPDLPMSSLDEMANFVRHDWTVINPLRAGWIERFNKEVAA